MRAGAAWGRTKNDESVGDQRLVDFTEKFVPVLLLVKSVATDPRASSETGDIKKRSSPLRNLAGVDGDDTGWGVGHGDDGGTAGARERARVQTAGCVEEPERSGADGDLIDAGDRGWKRNSDPAARCVSVATFKSNVVGSDGKGVRIADFNLLDATTLIAPS